MKRDPLLIGAGVAVAGLAVWLVLATALGLATVAFAPLAPLVRWLLP